MNTSVKTRMLCEAALSIALSIALSYFKIPIGVSFGGFGGSIDLVMIPLLLFAFRWGAVWGIFAGFAFGTLKYFLAGGMSVSWVSLLLDYSVAYAMLGVAGLFRPKKDARTGSDRENPNRLLPLAAFVGCAARFLVHYASGVTVYAQYMPEEFMNHAMTTPAVYSLLYNGTYMLPNTILAVALSFALIPLLKRIPAAK